MEVSPRTYQRVAITAALKGLRSRFKRALVVLATGLGKTLTVAFITKEFRAKRILFLVHNNFILQHAIDEFRRVFSEKTRMATYNGMSKDGAEEASIVFATWQTMGRSLREWARNHFDLIIVDEAHHSEAETYRPVTQYFTGPKLGITATPDREDDADIRDVFGPEVVNITLEEAIARGWLPRIEYHVITDESLDDKVLQEIAAEIRESKKRFTMAEVNRRIFIRKRDVEIARIINGYDEKSIVFCASITHAERMNQSLKLGVTFHSATGESQQETWENNQRILGALRNGTVRRVCAVNAFNEGVDVPSVGLVAFCRVTASNTIFRQQLGRGLRPGKDKLVVLDFVGNLERIQQVRQMMNKIADLHERYTDESERSREGYERGNFEVSGAGFEFTFSDKIVDLMKILEYVEAEFYSTWQEASAAAIKLGIRSALDYSKGYKADPSLYADPNWAYKNFPGWEVFLGKSKYSTWQEASSVAIKLGIRDWSDYKKKYKADPRLPSSPDSFYPDFPGIQEFCEVTPYSTWQEAGRAALKMGIRNSREYKKKFQLDPKLRAHPDNFYGNKFPGWVVFLGGQSRDYYPTWQEAGQAAKRLKVKNAHEYKNRYKRDPLLPSNPHTFYADFPGMNTFLGTAPRGLYRTCKEAMKAAKKFNFVSKQDYQSRRKKCDPMLPSVPSSTYPDFPGWDTFLSKK